MEGDSLVTRMAGAARLDRAVWRDLEQDPRATAHVTRVVTVVGLAEALGMADAGLRGAGAALLATFLGWWIWTACARVMGAVLTARGRAGDGRLLPALGLAQSPRLLAVFGFFPALGWPLAILLSSWVLLAGIAAASVTLGLGTGRALVTVLPGWILLVILRAVFGW